MNRSCNEKINISEVPMKKFLAMTMILAALLCSCGGETAEAEESAVSVNVDEVINTVVADYSLTDGFVFTSSSTELGEYLDDDLIMGYYGDAVDVPDFTKISEYCVYIDESDPNVFIDVGLFKLNDASYADTLMQYFQTRIDDKIAKADSGYPDIDVPTLEAATVAKHGDYVYYVISYDVDAITAYIETSIGK